MKLSKLKWSTTVRLHGVEALPILWELMTFKESSIRPKKLILIDRRIQKKLPWLTRLLELQPLQRFEVNFSGTQMMP